MTTKLAVRYRRPAHINRELTIRAELVADDGRRIDIEADLLDGEQILANAKGTWPTSRSSTSSRPRRDAPPARRGVPGSRAHLDAEGPCTYPEASGPRRKEAP